MAASKDRPAKPGRELIVLDFQEHGVTEGLRYLLEKAEAGQISGLVFAARMEGRHDDPYFFGAAGRLLRNNAEGIGAAVLLQKKLIEGT